MLQFLYSIQDANEKPTALSRVRRRGISVKKRNNVIKRGKIRKRKKKLENTIIELKAQAQSQEKRINLLEKEVEDTREKYRRLLDLRLEEVSVTVYRLHVLAIHVNGM